MSEPVRDIPESMRAPVVVLLRVVRGTREARAEVQLPKPTSALAHKILALMVEEVAL